MDRSNATVIPPVEVVLGEVITNLVLAAHAYLEPVPPASVSADLEAAGISIDLAAQAYERIARRLPESDRGTLSRLLTEVRLSYVKKRGL